MLAGGRDVVERGSDVGEGLRRFPRERVPDVDPVRPLGEPTAREIGELRREVEAVRLDRERRPARKALHEIAVRAADVEERPVPVDRVRDVAAGALPVLLGSRLAGLPPRRLRGEIRRDDELLRSAMPAVLVDLAALQRLVDLRDLAPLVLLQVGVLVGHAGKTTSALRPAIVVQLERSLELVLHERAHDGKAGPGSVPLDPFAVVRNRQHHLAVSLRERDRDVAAAVLEGVLEQLGEDERDGRGLLSRERDRLELRAYVLPGADALDEHRPQPVDELAEVDVVLAVLGQDLVHRGDREDTVHGVLERLARVDVIRAGLETQQRGDGLEVVLDAVVDLLGEDAPHDRSAVLERDGGVVGDRLEQRAIVVRERDVAVADELADLTSLPAQRHPHREGAGTPLGPGDLPVLEDEGSAGRMQRLHRRAHDRLERLLEVERLGDRLGDARERLELDDAPLRRGVELRVLDRLRDLRGDGDEEVDLRVRERARRPRPHVERSLQLVPREDGDGEDRLVLVLREVRELLEPRIEVRALRDHHRCALGGRDAGDPFSRAHARRAGHLLDAAAVRGPQDELVGTLVVEVDEARIRRERVGHLARNELEHLLQVERRVDGGDRLGEKAEVAGRRVHVSHCHVYEPGRSVIGSCA